MIAAFVIEKMSSYLAGGLDPASAARFTRGELEAIYKGSHYSRDAAGTMRPTAPPESLAIAAAMEKCGAALNEILTACAAAARETPGATPENAPRARPGTGKITGIEGFKELENYVRKETA
jgi:hypothetical protein